MAKLPGWCTNVCVQTLRNNSVMFHMVCIKHVNQKSFVAQCIKFILTNNWNHKIEVRSRKLDICLVGVHV